MMRNPRQDRSHRILCPVPPAALADAGALWWQGFGTAWPMRAPAMRAGHGIVAMARDGAVLGVAGLRDATGGFPVRTPMIARLGFRPATPTADLVVDGIIVTIEGQGIGRDLIAAALVRAAATGHPGLRVEVAAGNHRARRFFAAQGFVETGRGRFGWPWSGQVVLMRRRLGGR